MNQYYEKMEQEGLPVLFPEITLPLYLPEDFPGKPWPAVWQQLFKDQYAPLADDVYENDAGNFTPSHSGEPSRDNSFDSDEADNGYKSADESTLHWLRNISWQEQLLILLRRIELKKDFEQRRVSELAERAEEQRAAHQEWLALQENEMETDDLAL